MSTGRIHPRVRSWYGAWPSSAPNPIFVVETFSGHTLYHWHFRVSPGARSLLSPSLPLIGQKSCILSSDWSNLSSQVPLLSENKENKKEEGKIYGMDMELWGVHRTSFFYLPAAIKGKDSCVVDSSLPFVCCYLSNFAGSVVCSDQLQYCVKTSFSLLLILLGFTCALSCK